MSKGVRESVAAYGATLRPMSVREYYRGAEKGIFGKDEKLELIWGEVIKMSPQQSRHSMLVVIARNRLQAAFHGALLLDHSPFRLDDFNEPEPDVLVVKGTALDYLDRHPGVEDALLVVEVADSSLRKDRKLKSTLYASFGIQEYWIIDVKGKQLEVFRDPKVAGGKGHYASIQQLGRDQVVTPLNSPTCPIPISDLLPNA